MSIFQKLLATLFCSSWLTLAAAQLVLIYSATDGFRHDSIPTAIQSLKEHSPAHNLRFDNTEDRSWFTDKTLAKYDAVLFLDTTGEGTFIIVRISRVLTLSSARLQRQSCVPEVPQPGWQLRWCPCSF